LTGGEIGVRRGRTLFHLRGVNPDPTVYPEPSAIYTTGDRAFDAERPRAGRRHTVLLPKTESTGTYPRDARVVKDRYGVDRVDSNLPDPVVNVAAYVPPAMRNTAR
jgi:hypothetical protein